MSERAPPSSPESVTGRLERCIRDLVALNALPSICVGRSPAEALDIVMDALPTALSCDLVYLALPGSPPQARARLVGKDATEAELTMLTAALGAVRDESGAVDITGLGKLWCVEVDLPLGSRRGRLIAGRTRPLDPETDRMLIRSAANLVGTTLATAQVLETAHGKDEFLAMLGHELRNPLAPIMTAIELLARHPEAQREQKVLERQARHLARLVDDLLDISRVTRGHIELKSEPVELAAVLERAVELAAPLINRHRHTLRVDSAAGIALQGDPVRLAQVFGNLLNNAAKFTAPEGRLEVIVERAGGRVRVTVRDNGRGIPVEQLRRIFEPFVQAQGARDAARGGLGLGLAIVKNLVERHGGSVTVESKGEGQGSAFSVELPMVQHYVTLAQPPVRRAPPQRAGKRVLVVDDNVDITQLLSEALRLQGFETATAHDALGALDVWRRFGPQAAVLDLGLPELDGYELARRLRAEHGRQPVLIAATGYGQPQDRSRAAAAGFDCHLVKPVSVYELVQVLDGRLASEEVIPS
jgi:signal transduction histidine kinase/ActR/RegA family two-component response regulator